MKHKHWVSEIKKKQKLNMYYKRIYQKDENKEPAKLIRDVTLAQVPQGAYSYTT
jgi:hypothetical protein